VERVLEVSGQIVRDLYRKIGVDPGHELSLDDLPRLDLEWTDRTYNRVFEDIR